MRAVRVLLLCGLGMLDAAGCDGGMTPPAVRTVTVTPGRPAQPDSTVPSESAMRSSSPARVFNTGNMESAIGRLLTDTYKLQDVGAVSCPGQQPVVDGSRFQCTVDVAGTTKHVTITVSGEDGNYKVGPPE